MTPPRVRDEAQVQNGPSGDGVEHHAMLEDEKQRLADVREALTGCAGRLSQASDHQQVAVEAARICVDRFGAKLAWIGSAEPDGEIKYVAAYPPNVDARGPLLPPVRWDDTPEGQGPSARAIRTAGVVVVEDIRSDESTARWREAAVRGGFRSLASIPLVSRSRALGVLNVASGDSDFFRAERLDAFRTFAAPLAMALANARLQGELERRVSQLEALRAIDQAISGSLDRRVTLTVLATHAARQLGVDATAVLLIDPGTQTLVHSAGSGFLTGVVRRTNLCMGEGLAGRAALERKPIVVQSLAKEGGRSGKSSLFHDEKFVFYAACPMIARGAVCGVLEAFHRSPRDVDFEWIEFFEALAGQGAIAIDSVTMFDDLQRSNAQLVMAYDGTIEGWARALDLRDKETEGHSKRVTDATVLLAKSAGIDDSEIVHVRRGALLHDIGKLGIPDSILLKPAALTPDEWVVMRKHPVFARDILSGIPFLKESLEIPYCHHEKWDGSGYPRGLCGPQIPRSASVFAVVDVWDALRSDRPYRPGWPAEKVREHIRSSSGTHFDPSMVSQFLDAFDDLEGLRPAMR